MPNISMTFAICLAAAFLAACSASETTAEPESMSQPMPMSQPERPHPALAIVSPSDGASLPNPVTIEIGFAGGGGNPPDAGGERYGGGFAGGGYGGGGGFGGFGGGHRHHGMHLYLLVDQPPPTPGAALSPDSNHIAMQPGEHQTTLTLAPGPHRLQLVGVDRDGNVSERPPSPPVNIMVQ